jgi:hypothetical protein
MALPDEQKTCPVSGHRIAYYRQGSGESVILFSDAAIQTNPLKYPIQ